MFLIDLETVPNKNLIFIIEDLVKAVDEVIKRDIAD